MKRLLFESIGFCVAIVSAPVMAWRFPRTDGQFPLMNALAAASVAVACVFLTAAFLKQDPKEDQLETATAPTLPSP
jgi:hypothetical protein